MESERKFSFIDYLRKCGYSSNKEINNKKLEVELIMLSRCFDDDNSTSLSEKLEDVWHQISGNMELTKEDQNIINEVIHLGPYKYLITLCSKNRAKIEEISNRSMLITYLRRTWIYILIGSNPDFSIKELISTIHEVKKQLIDNNYVELDNRYHEYIVENYNKYDIRIKENGDFIKEHYLDDLKDNFNFVLNFLLEHYYDIYCELEYIWGDKSKKISQNIESKKEIPTTTTTINQHQPVMKIIEDLKIGMSQSDITKFKDYKKSKNQTMYDSIESEVVKFLATDSELSNPIEVKNIIKKCVDIVDDYKEQIEKLNSFYNTQLGLVQDEIKILKDLVNRVYKEKEAIRRITIEEFLKTMNDVNNNCIIDNLYDFKNGVGLDPKVAKSLAMSFFKILKENFYTPTNIKEIGTEVQGAPEVLIEKYRWDANYSIKNRTMIVEKPGLEYMNRGKTRNVIKPKLGFKDVREYGSN